jgi:hypothetical protein
MARHANADHDSGECRIDLNPVVRGTGTTESLQVSR